VKRNTPEQDLAIPDVLPAVLRRTAPPGGHVRAFLLSPASASGRRAQGLLREGASFPLARLVRSSEGAPIGQVFSFLSGLYFRGKAAYARAFAPAGGSFVITPDRGLLSIDEPITAEVLRAFASVDVRHDDPRFTDPLTRDARTMMQALGDDQVLLLGSIASKKYVAVLGAIFGPRLLFPSDFIGRGDMSRGGLLLRSARAGAELAYEPVVGAQRRGKRPPRLTPVRGILKDTMREELTQSRPDGETSPEETGPLRKEPGGGLHGSSPRCGFSRVSVQPAGRR
jgi:hypothetical protein